MKGISFKLIGITAGAAAVIGAGNVSAHAATVQWNPQNTVVSATLASGSSLVMTDNRGARVTCTTVTSNVKAPIGGNAAVAGTVNTSGTAAPPSITSCTNTVFPSASTTVTASGQWLFTATSASAVNASQASSVVSIGGLCRITVSNAAIASNAWNNTTHQLALNSGASFPISESGFCDGATSATISGTLQLPSSVTIA